MRLTIPLWDHTGRPAGHTEIPEDILRAAAQVYYWMREHNCEVLHGLRIDTRHVGTAKSGDYR